MLLLDVPDSSALQKTGQQYCEVGAFASSWMTWWERKRAHWVQGGALGGSFYHGKWCAHSLIFYCLSFTFLSICLISWKVFWYFLQLGHFKLQGKCNLLQYDYQRHHSDDDSRCQVNRTFFEYPQKLSTSGTTLIENPPQKNIEGIYAIRG